jgi:hypothetical protein
MKKTMFVFLFVLSLGIFGCARRQQVQSVEPEQTQPEVRARITVTIDARPNGDIVTVDYYENDALLMIYEYFDGDIREELGEINGAPLRARVAMRDSEVNFIVIIYLDDNNIIGGFVVIGDSYVEIECSQSQEMIERCAEMQNVWEQIYVRLELERRVAEELRR